MVCVWGGGGGNGGAGLVVANCTVQVVTSITSINSLIYHLIFDRKQLSLCNCPILRLHTGDKPYETSKSL